ncbi:MAG: metallophosphoesterase [Chloroflexi bacterium HGW-Chloroflexi-1]|nr:MAG: metallophosphoesterase [Chloroflexi bacterium HGW-Chloroflexi-1]
MRVLVLSDIHANLAALDAVLADAEQFNWETVWCLGDTVSYGPEPNQCVTQIQLLGATAVVGNHDWAALGHMDIDKFNPEARRAVIWTRAQLSAESMTWLRNLPGQPLVRDAFTLTHGSPRNPVWEYVLYPATARANFDHFATPFCLVGHTHVPALYIWQKQVSSVRALSPAIDKALPLEDGWRVIMNPGSVGQPRDNDPRAAYAVLDTATRTWLSRRVAYPIEITQAHMRAVGLPERLINRLSFGW